MSSGKEVRAAGEEWEGRTREPRLESGAETERVGPRTSGSLHLP